MDLDAAATDPFGEANDAPRASAWGQLRRLALKELREILRDRRTIITLVLMPLLLYPLLSMAFRQFFLSSLIANQEVEYRIGFPSERQHRWFQFYLRVGDQLPSQEPADANPPRRVTTFQVDDLEAAVRDGLVDLGIRLKNFNPHHATASENLAVDCEFLLLENSPLAQQALREMEQRLARANEAFLTAKLRSLNSEQRAVPVRAQRVEMENREGGHALSLTTLIPLILILMTITGAVYPAIDLTAGERERGTLEMLVAAPVPRLGLLMAKYASVLTVALLTATINLVSMTITVAASGLSPLLFGEAGLSLWLVLQVFGLLILFAAFFSAVLLTLTSFARSFKEAQAYLIPLMLVSLGPGMLSMMPGLRLGGLLSITPLVNIVLLGRDLFAGSPISPAMAAAVVVSTVLYAVAAISVAARVFGAEAVLYDAQSGWNDLFARPREERVVPTVSGALFCLAVLFPSYYLSTSLMLLQQGQPLGLRLFLMSLTTALLFGALPLGLAAWGRIGLRSGLNLRRGPWLAYPAAVLLGGSLWTLAFTVSVWQKKHGGLEFSPEQIKAAEALIRELRDLGLVATLLALAIIPAIFEELFFRGYLFSALRARLSPWWTILASALLFGLFHVVTTDRLSVERFLPTAFLGVVLGWVCWRTGSVFPGMLLHACHNGLLLGVAHYLPQISARGWGVAEQDYLPPTWLAAAAVIAGTGALIIHLFSRRRLPR